TPADAVAKCSRGLKVASQRWRTNGLQRYGSATMSERRTIELAVTLDGRSLASETTCMWAGPYVLTIATTLPDRGLAVELHSTFVGHEGVPTCVTHLTLGPVGHEPAIAQVEHDRASL